MTITVDTNILVRVVTRDHPTESAEAEALPSSNDVIVTNHALCELVWVLRRVYKLEQAELIQLIRTLAAVKVSFDRAAVEAGLAMLEAGGDFADGVIAFEGRRLGGRTFATFDRKAAAILEKTGQDCLLLGADKGVPVPPS